MSTTIGKGVAFGGNNHGPINFTVKGLAWLAAAVVLIAACWAGWAWYGTWRDLDVTTKAQLTGDSPTAADGTLTLQLLTPANRSHLRLTLTIADSRPTSELCLPHASVAVAPGAGTGFSAKTAVNGGEVTLPLIAGSSRPGLLLTLKADPGCVMDITVAKAVLTNDTN